jgi:hypothetical protein
MENALLFCEENVFLSQVFIAIADEILKRIRALAIIGGFWGLFFTYTNVRARPECF